MEWPVVSCSLLCGRRETDSPPGVSPPGEPSKFPPPPLPALQPPSPLPLLYSLPIHTSIILCLKVGHQLRQIYSLQPGER